MGGRGSEAGRRYCLSLIITTRMTETAHVIGARLLGSSGAGFTDGLAQLAGPHSGVVLIGPAELYAGSGS